MNALALLGLDALGGLVAPPPVLAAGWIDALGPMLVVGFWILRQIYVAVQEQRDLERAKEQARERGEPWPPGPAPPPELDEARAGAPPAEAPVARPAADQGDLRSEVEEFLRRAGVPAPPAPPVAPPAEAGERPRRPVDPFDEPQRRPRPPRPARPKPRVEGQRPASRPPIAPPPSAPAPQPAAGGSGIRRLPESQLAERASHLGESVAAADERADARLHEKFDHRLGNLGARAGNPAQGTTGPQSAAARIRTLLMRPEGAREALLMAEVLRRPTDSR